MKALFYYLFGCTSTLYVLMVLFNLYAPELMDDYWLDYIAIYYPNAWYYSSLIITAIQILFSIIFVFNLGKGTNHDRKESLLINKKEKENE